MFLEFDNLFALEKWEYENGQDTVWIKENEAQTHDVYVAKLKNEEIEIHVKKKFFIKLDK